MKINEVLKSRFRREVRGGSLAADVRALVAANVNEPAGMRTRAPSRHPSRMEQRQGTGAGGDGEQGEPMLERARRMA